MCSFSIDRQTDPLRQFSVDGNGLVMTTRRLDRESQPSHRVHVLAVDKGCMLFIKCCVGLPVKRRPFVRLSLYLFDRLSAVSSSDARGFAVGGGQRGSGAEPPAGSTAQP